MTRPLTPETRAKISAAAKISQKRRFATPEGLAHQRKMTEAAALAKNGGWVTPPEFKNWNTKMQNAGVLFPERRRAISEALRQSASGEPGKPEVRT